MHSYERSRRHQRQLDDEDMSPSVSRIEERRSASYTRAHRHSSRSDAYSRTSVSNRSTYAEPESRSHRAEDWRVPEVSYSTHDRYDDGYTQSRRDDYYDRVETRSSEPWASRHSDHTQYTSTNRQWPKRDDQGFAVPSFSESRVWAYSSRYEENGRNGYEEYPSEETRHREKGRYEREENYAHQSRAWRTGASGWTDDTDNRTSSWTERTDDQGQYRNTNLDWDREREKDSRDKQRGGERASYAEERQWEPAAAWKSREKDTSVSYRPERYDNQLSYKTKKARNKHGKSLKIIQKKDRRREDNMNNWQKREFKPVKKEKESQKTVITKHRNDYEALSRSRSRSRSPAPSVYSVSSRSRTKSPPQRQRSSNIATNRRDYSPPHATPKKGINRRRLSVSPDTGRREGSGRQRHRRESISSRSSRSRSRSRSASRSRNGSASRSRSGSRSSRSSSSEVSEVKRKAKHRLPTATSLRDIEIQAKNMTRISMQSSYRKNNIGLKNGQASKNAQDVNRRVSTTPISSRVENDDHAENEIPVPIFRENDPPPEPSSVNSATLNKPDSSANIKVDPSAKPQQKGQKKNAGFKPIAQSSASVKRFFPGDDDSDSDTLLQEQAEAVHSNNGIRERIRDDVHHKHDSYNLPEASPRLAAQRNRQDVPLERGRPSIASRAGSTPSAKGNTSMHGDGTQHTPRSRQGEENEDARSVEGTPKDQVYTIVSQVGEGTFGKVYKARNRNSGAFVALKRIRMEAERDGFPVTAMREIKLLQSLRHVNVIQLMEMMVHNGSVYMVFEYMDHDLTGVLTQTQFTFEDAHLKSFCQQMLAGLAYLHKKAVIHRDIKGSNILIDNRGVLKLADFGLARFYQKRRRSDYTNRVITLWYRPPELLLGTTVYGPEVDMWSAGCIMLELFCKKPIFQGNDEIHQLDVIYKILGTPTVKRWPGLMEMPWFELVKPKETLRNRFRELFLKWLSPAGLDLAERLLNYDPTQRATAEQALEAPYFTQEMPPPMRPEGLSSLEGEWHELESKRERAKKRRRVEGALGSESFGTHQ